MDHKAKPCNMNPPRNPKSYMSFGFGAAVSPQGSLMEGKVIKEEQTSVVVHGPSPCPSPLLTASSTTATTSSSTSNSGAGVAQPPPPGKENRRVASPLHNNSNASSEILTRSRSKGLGKEGSHSHHSLHHHSHHSSHHSHSHHHHHHSHSRDSPKVGGGSSMVIAPSSPSPPTSKSSSSSNGSSCGTASHQYERPGSGRESVRESALNMSSGAISPPVNGSVTPGATPGSARETSGGGGSGNAAAATTTTTRTPSSSSSSNSSNSGSSNGMNPGASLRHILKIKRFLGTLLHFGCEISLDVGERVRNLVFNLVSGHLSIEEFHHSLQEVTSFPLRPFVLPFLRAHLPILQREVSHLARLSKQTPLSYIQSHEHAIIDTGSTPGEPCDIFHSEASEMGTAAAAAAAAAAVASSSGGVPSGKRKLPDSLYENGDVGGEPGYTSTPKRHHAGSFFTPPFFLSSAGSANPAAMTAAEFREYYASAAAAAGYPLCSSANNSGSSGGSTSGVASQSHHSSGAHNATSHNSHESMGGGSGGGSQVATPGGGASNGLHMTPKGPEDEWKNIHVMLNCILSMVEKTKRALTILQNRTFQQQQDQGDAGNSSSWLRRPPMYPNLETSEEIKRQTSEMIAQALRATEDRVSEVKRRAEEAVQEVKRQALVELKRAVAAAEARACEAVATERARLERILLETAAVGAAAAATARTTRTPGEIGNPLIVGSGIDPEACWNCGRKAHETCSGCNMARYCSSFCQHKDWENHHSVCGRAGTSSSSGAPSAGVGREEQQRERATSSSSTSVPSDTKSSAGHHQHHHSHHHHPLHHARESSNSPPGNSSNNNGSGNVSNVARNTNSASPRDDHSPGSTN